jgi:hypothetical protein
VSVSDTPLRASKSTDGRTPSRSMRALVRV